MPLETLPKLTPVQVAERYGFPSNYTGKGQSVAIISIGGAIVQSELEEDFKALGLNLPKINVTAVTQTEQSASPMDGPSGENHLDIEVIGSICQDATINVYQTNNMGAAIAKAVEDGNPVISVSLGLNEGPEDKNSSIENALKQAVEKGVTVCVSSGDGGSSNTRAQSGGAIPAPDGKAHVSYPASSPNVLACGGTGVNADGEEVVWNQTDEHGGATGGGVSEVFDLPDWQVSANINIASVNNGQKGRVVPDVAGLAAAGDWKIDVDGQSELIGGTSAVAPLWSALCVLVNEARAEAGKKPLGFINDRLYQLAQQGGYFADITQGNNKVTSNYPGYAAREGFDACTGWGVPKGATLFKALVDL